jgi:hypothetical protein
MSMQLNTRSRRLRSSLEGPFTNAYYFRDTGLIKDESSDDFVDDFVINNVQTSWLSDPDFERRIIPAHTQPSDLEVLLFGSGSSDHSPSNMSRVFRAVVNTLKECPQNLLIGDWVTFGQISTVNDGVYDSNAISLNVYSGSGYEDPRGIGLTRFQIVDFDYGLGYGRQESYAMDRIVRDVVFGSSNPIGGVNTTTLTIPFKNCGTKFASSSSGTGITPIKVGDNINYLYISCKRLRLALEYSGLIIQEDIPNRQSYFKDLMYNTRASAGEVTNSPDWCIYDEPIFVPSWHNIVPHINKTNLSMEHGNGYAPTFKSRILYHSSQGTFDTYINRQYDIKSMYAADYNSNTYTSLKNGDIAYNGKSTIWVNNLYETSTAQRFSIMLSSPTELETTSQAPVGYNTAGSTSEYHPALFCIRLHQYNRIGIVN